MLDEVERDTDRVQDKLSQGMKKVAWVIKQNEGNASLEPKSDSCAYNFRSVVFVLHSPANYGFDNSSRIVTFSMMDAGLPLILIRLHNSLMFNSLYSCIPKPSRSLINELRPYYRFIDPNSEHTFFVLHFTYSHHRTFSVDLLVVAAVEVEVEALIVALAVVPEVGC